MCHVNGSKVAGSSSDAVKLIAHLNVSFKDNLLGDSTHDSNRPSSGTGRKESVINQNSCFVEMVEKFSVKRRRKLASLSAILSLTGTTKEESHSSHK